MKKPKNRLSLLTITVTFAAISSIALSSDSDDIRRLSQTLQTIEPKCDQFKEKIEKAKGQTQLLEELEKMPEIPVVINQLYEKLFQIQMEKIKSKEEQIEIIQTAMLAYRYASCSFAFLTAAQTASKNLKNNDERLRRKTSLALIKSLKQQTEGPAGTLVTQLIHISIAELLLKNKMLPEGLEKQIADLKRSGEATKNKIQNSEKKRNSTEVIDYITAMRFEIRASRELQSKLKTILDKTLTFKIIPIPKR